MLIKQSGKSFATAFLLVPGGGFSTLSLAGYSLDNKRLGLELSYTTERPNPQSAPNDVTITYSPKDNKEHWASEGAPSPADGAPSHAVADAASHPRNSTPGTGHRAPGTGKQTSTEERSMPGYSNFSFTALWARIGGVADSAVAAAGQSPRGVVVELPEEERAAMAAQLAPSMGELEQLRRQTLATVDRRARLLVPLAGGVVLLAVLLFYESTASALIFGLVAATAGWFVANGNRASAYQATVKQRLGSVVSGHLSGFEHRVEPQTDLAKLRAWCLFPDLQSARTLDQIQGERDGRPVSMAELSIAYAPQNSNHEMGDHRLSVSVVEVGSLATGQALLTLTPRDAPPRLLAAQSQAADSKASPTGDADFDSAFSLRTHGADAASATRLLTPRLRSAILALAQLGPAGRPYLVFGQESLTVLFPTQLADLAFHVPPYWVALDTDALLAQFASDLALKNALLNGVLGLPDLATWAQGGGLR